MNHIQCKIFSKLIVKIDLKISIFSKLNHPVLSPFFGYVVNNNKSFLLFKSNKDNSFEDHKLLNDHQKQIFFIYDLACALEILENNNIVHRYINRENIFLEDDLYPIFIGLELSNINDILITNSDKLAPELKMILIANQVKLVFIHLVFSLNHLIKK